MKLDPANRPIFRTVVGMMISPASAVKTAFSEIPWMLSALISALAFGMFFLQTGLDLYKTGQKNLSYLLMSGGLGIIYGLVVIPLLGALIWAILKTMKTDKGIKSAISSFCLSYSGALIYGILGLVFSVALGWKTSVAFGVTGVLWAIGPMIVTIREMTGGKNSLSIPIATLVSAVVLISWSVFGNL